MVLGGLLNMAELQALKKHLKSIDENIGTMAGTLDEIKDEAVTTRTATENSVVVLKDILTELRRV